MFGRYVEIGDERVLVLCTPETPLSEVCRRAVRQFMLLEENEKAKSEWYRQYNAALTTESQP